jgi:hypothetical protein
MELEGKIGASGNRYRDAYRVQHLASVYCACRLGVWICRSFPYLLSVLNCAPVLPFASYLAFFRAQALQATITEQESAKQVRQPRFHHSTICMHCFRMVYCCGGVLGGAASVLMWHGLMCQSLWNHSCCAVPLRVCVHCTGSRVSIACGVCFLCQRGCAACKRQELEARLSEEERTHDETQSQLTAGAFIPARSLRLACDPPSDCLLGSVMLALRCLPRLLRVLCQWDC